MWIKRCRHCENHYLTSMTGQLPLVFCQACRVLAETALEAIKTCQAENPQATMWHFQHVLKIPTRILSGLYRAGEIRLDLQRKKPRTKLFREDRPPCTVCQCALKESEIMYCSRCSEIIAKRVVNRGRPSTSSGIRHGSASPLGGQRDWSTPTTPKVTRR